jgi:hypothetical protein
VNSFYANRVSVVFLVQSAATQNICGCLHGLALGQILPDFESYFRFEEGAARFLWTIVNEGPFEASLKPARKFFDEVCMCVASSLSRHLRPRALSITSSIALVTVSFAEAV